MSGAGKRDGDLKADEAATDEDDEPQQYDRFTGE